ncbi:MAG: hypothetical protein ACLGH0_01190 [Thermoanaerobaculia bacterium]
MKRIVLLSLLLVAQAAFAADECPSTGPETAVGELKIVFTNCPPPERPTVRWFEKTGKFRGQFTVPPDQIRGGVGPKHQFFPQSIFMATASGRGCVPGTYGVRPDGRCYAEFAFPCADRTFRLIVEASVPVTYGVTRKIPARERDTPCLETLEVPPSTVDRFSDTELIEVRVFTVRPRKKVLSVVCNATEAKCEPQEESVVANDGRTATDNAALARQVGTATVPNVVVKLAPM